MTVKEIPEIKTYKELKSRVETERRKLSEMENKLAGMRNTIKELEGKISESELTKQKNMERFALGEIPQSELNKAKKLHLEAIQEYNDTKELIDIIASSIQKQTKVVLEVQRDAIAASSKVWNRMADKFQKELEASVGDTVKSLWVAMLNASHHCRSIMPHELPERLRIFGTPERDAIAEMKETLWNEFVEEN